MRKLSVLAASLAVVPVLAFANPALAAESDSGQIEQGNIYRVRNISVNPNGEFIDPATATCGNTVQFRVRIHNPGPDPITNVKVAATLPSASATSHSSKVSVTASNVGGQVVTDTAGVNLDKTGTLNYVGGSTELLDSNGSKLNNLPDGITGGGTGVNIGTVGTSVAQKRFVQFQAKVNCPTPPEDCKTNPKLCPPPVTPPSTPPTTTPIAPTGKLVETGPGETAAVAAIATIAGTLGYRKFLSRRLSRQ